MTQRGAAPRTMVCPSCFLFCGVWDMICPVLRFFPAALGGLGVCEDLLGRLRALSHKCYCPVA